YFTSLFNLVRVSVFILKNIKAGFAIYGLFLFNLDRVLRSIPVLLPPTKPAIPSADETIVGS
ncbi:hypothetical protein F5882DRAFT_246794, partial [Hyaloscypha sp. PMI_1271]